MTLLIRASLRYLLRHRAQCTLAVSGIALGVAIVVGMQVAQLSARQAFAASLTSVFGAATHRVLSDDGPFPDTELARIRRIVPGAYPTPIVDGGVRYVRNGHAGRLRLIGIDVLTAHGAASSVNVDLRQFLLDPDAVLTTEATARRLGLARGSRLRIETPAGAREIVIAGVLDEADDEHAMAVADDVLLADIATAQELLGRIGALTRVDLDCAACADPEPMLASLRTSLPAGLRVEPAGSRERGARNLTRAFYTNLDALSLLALLVGGFMIYNTMTFLVVQRQTLFGRLRALGVSRRAVAGLIAAEAALLGLVGGISGVALGYALATRLMAPVTQTMRDHYFDARDAGIVFSFPLAAAALALALLVTVLAALGPALAASRAAPADAGRHAWQQAGARRGLDRAAAWGAGAGCAGLLILLFSTRSLIMGFAALGLLILAAMLCVPRIVQALLRGLAGLTRLGLAERIAIRGAERALGRIGMAVAALMAATAASIGVGLMVGSFRVSVADWLDQLLRADIYVARMADEQGPPTITPDLVERLRALPGVQDLSLIRRARLTATDGEMQVNAYALPPAARRAFRFIDGAIDGAFWTAWEQADRALVSEPYAYRHRLRRGDAVTLATPAGPRRFRIDGIYVDYGNERGVVAISLARYRAHWRDLRVHGAGIYPAADTDRARVIRAIEEVLPPSTQLAVWSNAAVKRRSLAIFDRTFAVTDVLTVFSTLIAALGVFNALLALHLERSREYAVMLAAGASAGLLRRVLYSQALIIGTLAALLAMPVGWLIALVLTDVINIRSFGWSMTLHCAPRALLLPAVCALLAALAATVYPAERAVRIDPADALRHE